MNHKQNLVKIGWLGRLGKNPNFGSTLSATQSLFLFFAPHPGPTARPTATIEGLKCVLPAKKVHFGGINNKK